MTGCRRTRGTARGILVAVLVCLMTWKKRQVFVWQPCYGLLDHAPSCRGVFAHSMLWPPCYDIDGSHKCREAVQESTVLPPQYVVRALQGFNSRLA